MKNKSQLEQANICAFEPAGLFFIFFYLFINKTNFSFFEADISLQMGEAETSTGRCWANVSSELSQGLCYRFLILFISLLRISLLRFVLNCWVILWHTHADVYLLFKSDSSQSSKQDLFTPCTSKAHSGTFSSELECCSFKVILTDKFTRPHTWAI